MLVTKLSSDHEPRLIEALLKLKTIPHKLLACLLTNVLVSDLKGKKKCILHRASKFIAKLLPLYPSVDTQGREQANTEDLACYHLGIRRGWVVPPTSHEYPIGNSQCVLQASNPSPAGKLGSLSPKRQLHRHHHDHSSRCAKKQ